MLFAGYFTLELILHRLPAAACLQADKKPKKATRKGWSFLAPASSLLSENFAKRASVTRFV